MNKLRYGLIGCGQAGLVHAYHFSKDPRIHPVACMDIDVTKAERVKNELAFEKAFADLATMLKEVKLDLVSIATPPSEHAAQIQAVAVQGIQILCEKPLVLAPEEVKPTLEICRRNNIRLAVMLPRRFYNNSLATKKVLAEGGLGSIREVQFSLECRKEDDYYAGWRGQKNHAGGGVLMSQAIHSIDQLVFFFGRPKTVSGRVWTVRPSIDVEDEAEGTIFFQNGVKVKLRATTNSKEHAWKGITEIVGSSGKIVLDSQEVLSWDVPGAKPPEPEEKEAVSPAYKPSYYGPGHRKVIANFVATVQGKEGLLTPGRSSMDALRIIWGVYRSSERGGQVMDLIDSFSEFG